MKVCFIGAGPGAPDLITVRGKRILESADIVIYAGSLVSAEMLTWARTDAVVLDSSKLDLAAVVSVYTDNAGRDGTIARLHTGDPAIYGAIQEQIDHCVEHSIPWEIIPGVSSVFASAAALGRELTLPGITQTLTIGRIAGRTSVPERENLETIGAHGGSLALLLSVNRIADVVESLRSNYSPDTPVSVVYRATWDDEKIVRGTIDTIVERVTEAGITRQAIILVGKALASAKGEYDRSKLYDSDFSHGYRGSR